MYFYVENEAKILVIINLKNMNQLRIIIDVMMNLLWLTNVNMLNNNSNFNFILFDNSSRVFMLKQPVFCFSVLNIENF